VPEALERRLPAGSEYLTDVPPAATGRAGTIDGVMQGRVRGGRQITCRCHGILGRPRRTTDSVNIFLTMIRRQRFLYTLFAALALTSGRVPAPIVAVPPAPAFPLLTRQWTSASLACPWFRNISHVTLRFSRGQHAT
jgi:hypothetical protein